MSLSALRTRRGAVETRFGRFSHDRTDVVEMVEPLAGFETCRQYVLLSPHEIAPLVCLQGLDGARPSFLAMPPHLADPQYITELSDEDRERLGLLERADRKTPPLWLVLVRVDAKDASANLRAPIVINPAKMIGLQVVSSSSSYSTEHPLPLG